MIIVGDYTGAAYGCQVYAATLCMPAGCEAVELAAPYNGEAKKKRDERAWSLMMDGPQSEQPVHRLEVGNRNLTRLRIVATELGRRIYRRTVT